MPRVARMIISNEPAVYHVMSRTALDGFPLGDIEKDFMLDLIKRYAALYFTEIYGFCLMGNHFHLLVKMIPEINYSDEAIQKRFEAFYGKNRAFSDNDIPYLREKLSSLSELVREIKVGFSRFYNKRHNRRGYFWGDRFKSLIVQKGETLVNCLAYIDLNPLRAGIAEKPETYRWSSLGYHVQTNNKDNLLSFDFGLNEFSPKELTSQILCKLNDAAKKEIKERIRLYRKYVYEAGAVHRPFEGKPGVIDDKTIEKEIKKNFELTRTDRFRYRTRYFTDSGIIGTKEFVSDHYQLFKHVFNSKHEKKPRLIKGLEGVYSLKRLSEA